jgi:hypothetical protein
LNNGLGLGTSTDRKKVMRENITPEIKAVAIPLNVPINRTGRPNVNKMSNGTCILTTFDMPIALHNIITYESEQIKLRNSMSITIALI